MKYAYDRYVRPGNDFCPTDPLVNRSIPDLTEEDCPEDIFLPLKSKQESSQVDFSAIPIVPGLPHVQPKFQEYEI